MTDDTERRLRESLRGANLPGAPDALRDALHAVAVSPAPVPPRRTWLRTLPALAAVVVLAIVAASMTGGAGLGLFGGPASPSGTGTASASASASSSADASTTTPSATVPPRVQAPPTSVDVLDADSLRDEIRLVKTGGEIAHDVVVNVGGSPRQRETFVATPCSDGQGTCTLVAQLDGFDEATGSVSIRAQDNVLPPPVDAASLAAPLALHIAADGSLELIGHVDLSAGTGRLDMNGLRADTPDATPGHVVAVLGWLGKLQGASCGPANNDVPAPFACPGVTSFLSDEPVEAMQRGADGSYSGSLPTTAVRVGATTYDRFAPSPSTHEFNGVPRQGLYLLRMVALDQTSCRAGCGWLLVGRLDLRSVATASNLPSFNAGVKVYDATEVDPLLAGDRSSWVGKAILVHGSVVPLERLKCSQPSAGCAYGKLVGSSEWIEMSTYTEQMAGTLAGGTMALRVQPDGLEFLGLMAIGPNGVDSQAPVGWLDGFSWSGDNALTTFIVKAYLGWSGPLPCPSVPGSPPPADTPFGSGCPWAWLASTDSITAPADSVAVQPGAYADFAGPAAGASPPKFGTYLVRLVVDTRIQGRNAPSGWQVVARLSP